MLMDLFHKFSDRKWFAFDFVETNGVNQISAANQQSQLPHVQFWDEDVFESRDDLP
jgi:hypothetical protein